MAYIHDLETFRLEEYPMLKGKTYLDHGGSTLYAKSLIEEFSCRMISNLYGNPHSASDPATLSGKMIHETREKALKFFGADPVHFDLVFVANATAATKLVMDCFKDLLMDSPYKSFRYLYHVDSHTSIVGVREATQDHFCFQTDKEVEDWLDDDSSQNVDCAGHEAPGLSLFAYPAQSNMTGRRLPLEWPGRIRKSALRLRTYSLLDAAAFAMSHSLESVFVDPESAPDFTALSFYKIFGFPDLGALIIRRRSNHVLTYRKYFGGGTVDMVTVMGHTLHYKRRGGIHNRLEDGTLGFHNIMALGCAIDVHHRLYRDMNRVSHHVSYLVSRLYRGLKSICHENGNPLCEIYNQPGNEYNDIKTQGGTIAFNVRKADGSYVSYSEVEATANANSIFIRAGSL